MEEQLKSAKLKALSLLNHMDRTEAQLRRKLKEKGYEEKVINQTLEYVKSFGYINDLSYAERYILGKQESKSRKEIYAGLCQKGISREIIQQAMEQSYDAESEEEAILRICEKKHFSPETSTEAEKKKIFDYLLRKGFRVEEVRQVIQVSSWNA